MFCKADKKKAIENWRFKVVVESKGAMTLLQSSTGGHPVDLRGLLETFGRALDNGRRYLESSNFQLLEDGSLLAQPPLAMLPDRTLIIDLMDTFNLNALQGLDKAISARKVKSGFAQWHVTGYLEGNPKHSQNLVMNDRGNLYIGSARSAWRVLQHPLGRRLV